MSRPLLEQRLATLAQTGAAASLKGMVRGIEKGSAHFL